MGDSEMVVKVCPFVRVVSLWESKFTYPRHSAHCIKEQCAWWESITGTCCVKTEAYLAAFNQAVQE
jgi:hypothetical protein